ncbi:MAG: ribosome small subunit-dependent GTPase A [Clostridia bacterium]|nr:ribosome small subunit-dependent GTPase A [Clostridia bacterium]
MDCIICINKSDLGEANDIVDIYRNIGYDVVLTSAKDDTGVDVLKEKIVGKTAVFVGNSGVGKSSLTNKLLKTKVMEEGDLSKIERGKQTTRHTELLKISDNTYIADSPGFSSFELGEIDDIASLFVEFNEYIGECKYRDCRHIKEDDCAIKKALAEGKISKSRYDNFCLLANKQ